MTKRTRPWTYNVPSTVTIAPGGYYVFDVDFDPKTWDNSPLQERRTPVRQRPVDGGARCRLRARYTITAPKPGDVRIRKPSGVPLWTGTVSSAEKTYVLWP
ncbi:hypothetical protein [Hymenobacter armeniacus]|uniref:Uncharacterized protein n=1 Tax=Hymenobacter armeniacus TaxID=2771358 RepID=A0ABR8JUN0_9BACT|nr:hypothetical protein [Hymenobacter armeniacus]MBD2722683.1 hypothetical protein [Hymenobacter armeniacus]